MKRWTFDDIPDQAGRTAVVTGANSGIGFEAARMLAKKRATVVLACRDAKKGAEALQRIEAERPAGQAVLASLDLADLESVATFATRFAQTHGRLDLLINNAGLMVPPLGRTKQGHELQFGTNHLGHFALTARLLPLLQATPGARVTVVSSVSQRLGRIDFADPDWQRRAYRRWLAYGQSKLANMLFALELQRRLDAAGSALKVTASHPGLAATDLGRASGMVRVFESLIGMSPSKAALTTLRAATDPAAAGGSFWGPAGLTGFNGPPVLARPCKAARDEAVAARLFDVSESLAGVAFDFSATTGSQRGAA
jgi:NAD(P)-dependent dehydrogenase (short-subunit alcohol dehydrogenase family)